MAEGVFAWLEGVEAWRRRLLGELASLPDTLADLREGVSNFEKVTRRLVEATEALEQLSRLYLEGFAQARQRMDELNRLVASVPGGERIGRAVEDLADAFNAIARLNPLLSRGGAGEATGRG